MAKEASARIVKELGKIVRGPKGAMKKMDKVIDLFREAGQFRDKEIEPALGAAIEVIENQLDHVEGFQLGLVEGALKNGLLSITRRRSRSAREFVKRRLDREYGAIPAVICIFDESPKTAFDQLSPYFTSKTEPMPHPVLAHAMHILAWSHRSVPGPLGDGRQVAPDVIKSDPRWTEIAVRLAKLLHKPRSPEWKMIPFDAIEVLSMSVELTDSAEAERALVALVGVVTVDTGMEAWSRIKMPSNRKKLRTALLKERKRLVAERASQDPEETARLEELERESDSKYDLRQEDEEDALVQFDRLIESL